MSTLTQFVQFRLEAVDHALGFLVSLPDLLLLGLDLPYLGRVGIVNHGVDLVSNALLVHTSLTQSFVDGLLHEVEFLNLRCVLLHLGGTLDAAAKRDAHFALGTTDHRSTRLNHVASERDKSGATHVLAGDAEVFHDQGVPQCKANGDIDAGVVIQHLVSEPENPVLSGGHDGFSTRPRTAQFVEWKEGCTTGPILSQPADGIGSILVGFNNHRGHTSTDGGGEGNFVSAVLWSAQFGHRTDDALQGLIVPCSEHGAGTACQALGAGFLFHLGLGEAQRTLCLSQSNFDSRSVFRELSLGALGLDQLAGEGFTVVFWGFLGQFLQPDVEFTKRQSNLLGFLLSIGELLAHEVGLHCESVDVGLGFSALCFMVDNERFC